MRSRSTNVPPDNYDVYVYLMMNAADGLSTGYVYGQGYTNYARLFGNFNSSSNYVIGTNTTGTYVTRTMVVSNGVYSGSYQIDYEAVSNGPLKWVLSFQPLTEAFIG